jgi:hypothetical protein
MKDYRQNPVPTRGGIARAVVVALIAVIVVIGPHLLRTSPTTNESTDPANGVSTTTLGSPPRCDAGRAAAWMTLRGYLHLAAATLCVARHQKGRLVFDHPSVTLTREQLRQLESDFNANSTSTPRLERSCHTAQSSTVVSGVTVEGQQVELFADSCTGEFAGAGRYWVPSAMTRATIRSALRH